MAIYKSKKDEVYKSVKDISKN